MLSLFFQIQKVADKCPDKPQFSHAAHLPLVEYLCESNNTHSFVVLSKAQLMQPHNQPIALIDNMVVHPLISNDIALLAYPSASATAVVLLLTVLIVIGILLRFVDIRKEL